MVDYRDVVLKIEVEVAVQNGDARSRLGYTPYELIKQKIICTTEEKFHAIESILVNASQGRLIADSLHEWSKSCSKVIINDIEVGNNSDRTVEDFVVVLESILGHKLEQQYPFRQVFGLPIPDELDVLIDPVQKKYANEDNYYSLYAGFYPPEAAEQNGYLKRPLIIIFSHTCTKEVFVGHMGEYLYWKDGSPKIPDPPEDIRDNPAQVINYLQRPVFAYGERWYKEITGEDIIARMLVYMPWQI